MINKSLHTIGESELIITDRGNIYHLDLAPQHLAHTVIFVGDQGRVKEVSKRFDEVTHTAHHREFITHTGRIGKKPISVVSTGIGPDNTDIVFDELDALLNIDFQTRTIKDEKKSLSVFRLGTCGALQNDIAVDSLIISSHAIGLDNLMHYYKMDNTPDERYILEEFRHHTRLDMSHILPYISESSISLRKHFGPSYHHGITVTCPGFYGPQGRSLRLAPAFPNLLDAMATFNCQNNRIVNFEMETAAIYSLGKMLGHKCISINCVVANRANKTFSRDHKRAVEDMIESSLELIAGL